MLVTSLAQQRRVLGDFLRSQRGRLSPAAAGLDAGTRRRTPGLRREEVAQLCGMSTTWYTWIEQGRDVSISPGALARLAVTLRLSPAERAYLFELAGKRDPSGTPGDPPPAPAALVASVDGFRPPAYLLDRAWNLLAWNPAAAELFAGWLDQPKGDLAGDHNLLRYVFLNPSARRLIPDWEHRARRVLAEFRADYSRHLDDAETRRLIEDLRARSPFFAAIWDEHAVTGRAGGPRIFNHPREGVLRYEQTSFNLADRPDFKLVLLTPVPKEAAV